MTAPESQLPSQGRLFNVLDRAYRNRTYRPARYYLTWYFLASVVVTVDFIVLGVYVYLDGGVELFLHRVAWVIVGFLASIFLAILSTYFGMLGSSLHLLDGDRGIYSLGSVPATQPVITKSTFVCMTPEQKALYPQELHGSRITRFMVWRWGRRGGCQNWPGKAGGKGEGFWSVVVYSWETAERLNPDGTSTGEVYVLEKQPCPTCNRGGQVVVPDAKGEWDKSWLGYRHVPALTTDQLQKMSQDTPGFKRGGVIDLRNQIMPDRYLEELPYELALAIQHDEEYRASSRVDVGYDPLPEEGSLGAVLAHNAEIELFGLQATSKRARHQIVSLHQTRAILDQLQGGNIGGGGPGQS